MRRVAIGLVLLACVSAPAAAQQGSPVSDIERVRNLYVAAAYAEALAAIPSTDGDPARIELEQYRALCLLALGREPEAVSAVERIVRDHPTFVPAASETTPRLLSIFATARSKVVPDLAKRAYADAKAAYDRNDKGAAGTGFRQTLDLIDSLPAAEKSSLDDLRLLAAGFLDLSAMTARPAASAPDPASAKPAATPAVPPATGGYAPPVAIREELPTWNPPDPAARRTQYDGLLRIQIGADGKVASATMVKRTHPNYDVAVIRAAKAWIYQPATRGGEPIASQKDIQVKLLPR